MSGVRTGWLSAALLAALCIAASAARAQPAADDPIARGVELRKQGKNAEALAEFERAYALSPSPRAIAQIALARQALGHWVEAEQGLVRALAAADDAWIARNATALRSALVTVRDHLASLRIETDVTGATIYVSGAPIGIAPLPSAVRVVAGEVRVEARAEGRPPASVTLVLAPRSEEQVRLVLPAATPPPSSAVEPANAAAAVPERPAAPVATAPPSRAPVSPPAAPQPPQDEGSAARTGAIIAFVAGGLLLGGAVTANVIRERDGANLNNEEYCRPKIDDCTRLYDRAKTAETLMIIGYAAAGAALATGVVLLLIAPDSPSDAHAALSLGVGADGARVVLYGAL